MQIIYLSIKKLYSACVHQVSYDFSLLNNYEFICNCCSFLFKCLLGDDPARKAVSDSIVSGCIPVIFEFRTLYDQYPWHLTEREALDISVYIPGGDVRSGQLDFMTVLLGISSDVIKMKQEALAMIAPRIQYAMPPPEYLIDRYDETIWDPPFKDGVELTIDGLFKRVNDVIHNRSTGIPHRLMSGRAWGNEYSNVRIQIPNSNYSHQYLNHRKKYVDYHKNRLNFHSSSGSRSSIGGRKGHNQEGNQSRNKIHHPFYNKGNMINKDNKRIIGVTHDFNNNNNNNDFPEGVKPHHPQHLHKAKKMNINNNNIHENSIFVGDNAVINNAHITDSTGTSMSIQIGGSKGLRHVKRLPIMEGPGEGEVNSDTT